MDYRSMSRERLVELKEELTILGHANAVVEISDFLDFYGKTVKVVKGRKVPKGTVGEVFWVKRYDNSKYGDPWGIYSVTKVGIRDAEGNAHFTSIDNVEIVGGEENV